LDQLRVLRPAAAAAYVGLSRPTLYRLERAGELPPRVLLGPNSSGWLIEDLDAFIAGRPRGTRQPAANRPEG
jgi:predicted DNA-binding transcriptional regulator AlpA